MSLLWPTNIKLEPTALARFGRVGHWFFAGTATLSAVAGVWDGWNQRASPDGYGPNYTGLWLGLMAGAGLWLAGRAFRYVFSGE